MAMRRSPDAAERNPDQEYQRGLEAFETGQYVEAIEALTPIADVHNLTGTLARFYLGQCHLRQGLEDLRSGDYQKAATHLAIARDINPDTANLSRFLASCYAGMDRFDMAATALEHGTQDDAADPDRSIRVAHAFARDGQMPRAVETLVKALDLQPHRIDVRLQLGLLYAASEEYVDAVCVFQEAAEFAPLDPEVRQNLGLVHAALDDYPRAIENLAVAQRIRPNDAHIAGLLALALDAAKRQQAEIAIDIRPGIVELLDAKSVEVLGELLVREPDFVEAFLCLPPSAVDGDLFAMLAKIFEHALERYPDYADLHYHCSRVHQRLGNTPSAIERANIAVSINPIFVQALIQLGRLFSQTDQSDEAITRLRKAVEHGAEYPDVHCLLGELYRKKGHRERAYHEFLRALELNENYTAAAVGLETLANA